MPISECCVIDVVCCEENASIPEVAALMRHHHVGDVIVIEDQNGKRVPVGIVTDRDIVVETVAQQVDVNAFTAGDLMSAPIATVKESDGIIETLRVMRNEKVRRVVVLTEIGSLFGMVTVDDLIHLMAIELSMLRDAIVDQPLREARLRK